MRYRYVFKDVDSCQLPRSFFSTLRVWAVPLFSVWFLTYVYKFYPKSLYCPQTNKQGWSPEALRKSIKLNKTMLSQQNSTVLLCGIWMRCVKMKQRQCGRYAMLHHWAQEGKGQYKLSFQKSEAIGCCFKSWERLLRSSKSHIPSTSRRALFLEFWIWPTSISGNDFVLWRLRPEPYFPRILRRSPSTLRGFGVAGEWRPSFLKVTLWTQIGRCFR